MILENLKEFYDLTYLGEPVGEGEFPRLQARAEDALMGATAGKLKDYPAWAESQVYQAACAQVEWYVFQGPEAAGGADVPSSFTTGHVSVSNGKNASVNGICRRAAVLLFPTGLLYAGVVTV